MGVAPTGQIFKGFTFDGESSKDYGIYITGSAVYNAPVRDVEMISIPGRNGSFALDKGRFENIEVTYPAGIYADTESDFAQGISDFRNFLASRQGYVKLSDDYNIGEYRLAVYKSGLDVSPEQLRAGEFEITFECKPQRFLTSGETEETVANNGTLTNPTLFDARPMLEVWGSGKVEFAGQSVTVNGSEPIGTVIVANSVVSTSISSSNTTQALDLSWLDSGDTYTSAIVSASLFYISAKEITSVAVSGFTTNWTGQTAQAMQTGLNTVTFDVTMIQPEFQKGTSVNKTFSGAIDVTYADSTSNSYNFSGVFTLSSGSFKLTFNYTSNSTFHVSGVEKRLGDVTGYSTLTTAGSPCYIDLDIGEAYKEVSGSYVSLNNTVEIGGDLPVLPPGTTTFTYPNTVTQLKVIPRWWKV